MTVSKANTLVFRESYPKDFHRIIELSLRQTIFPSAQSLQCCATRLLRANVDESTSDPKPVKFKCPALFPTLWLLSDPALFEADLSIRAET